TRNEICASSAMVATRTVTMRPTTAEQSRAKPIRRRLAGATRAVRSVVKEADLAGRAGRGTPRACGRRTAPAERDARPGAGRDTFLGVDDTFRAGTLTPARFARRRAVWRFALADCGRPLRRRGEGASSSGPRCSA